MKRLALVAVIGGVSYAAYRSWVRQQEEDALWAEATEPPA